MAPNKNDTGKPRSLPEATRRLLNIFQSDDHVLIYIAADPDSMGSALAFKRLLWRKVASVTIATINEIKRPDNLTMVRLLQIPIKHISEVNQEAYSKRVIVDGQPCHSELFPDAPIDVVIDHHPATDQRQAAYEDIRPRYGATCSIMTEYLKGAGINVSERLATALIYGIRTDTDNFGRPALDEDIKAFHYLYSRANQSVLRKITFSEMRLSDLQLVHTALESYILRGRRIFAHMGQVASPDNLVQIADFFQRIAAIDTCVVSGQFEDKVVVIVRNVAARVDAGKMVQRAFGVLGPAGGHKSMARAELPLSAIWDPGEKPGPGGPGPANPPKIPVSKRPAKQ